MNPIRVDDLDDPRLQVFRSLQSRPTAKREHEDLFITEGRTVVGRLLRSGLRVRSLLIDEGRPREELDDIDPSTEVFVASRQQIEQLAGFHFHRGYLACAERPREKSIDEVSLGGLALAAVEVTDMENFGSMLRSASALGVRQILLDRTTADPFCRRVARVSMGAVFGLELVYLDDPEKDFAALAAKGVVTLAATLADDAVAANSYCGGGRPTVLVVGNEARGLPTRVQQAASHRITIPMDRQHTDVPVDSLNVSVAAAILMYELRSRLRVGTDSVSIG